MTFVDDDNFVVDPQKAQVGQTVASAHCTLCHGAALVAGGTAPDLRSSPVGLSLDALRSVLHDGLLLPRGMPRFEELQPDQIEGLQHYIRQRARESLASQRDTGK